MSSSSELPDPMTPASSPQIGGDEIQLDIPPLDLSILDGLNESDLDLLIQELENNFPQEDQSGTNLQARLPQPLRENFHDTYYADFHGGFQQQAASEVQESYPVNPTLAQDLPSVEGAILQVEPPADQFNAEPSLEVWNEIYNQIPNAFVDPRRLENVPQFVPQDVADQFPELFTEDVAARFAEDFLGLQLVNQEHSGFQQNISYQEDSRNEDSYQDAVEYIDRLQPEDNIDDQIDPLLSLMPRYHHLPNQEQANNLMDYFYTETPATEGDEETDGTAPSEMMEISQDTFPNLNSNLSWYHTFSPETFADPASYLEDPMYVAAPSDEGDNELEAVRDDVSQQLTDTRNDDADDELGDTPQPPRKIIKIKFKARKPDLFQRLKIKFKRHVDYRKEIRQMQRDGRFKDDDEFRSVRIEVKFPELQYLVDDIFKRMTESLVLHEGLRRGVVGFSRWSVKGRCPDVELFDMLMAFIPLKREVDKEYEVDGVEDRIPLAELVPQHDAPEKRIDAHDFIVHHFPLPLRYLPDEGSIKGYVKGNPIPPSDSVMSFMGTVAIKLNRRTGDFKFSGLYHLIHFDGRDPEKIDLFKHQKDGSPFAAGSGGAVPRNISKGTSSRRNSKLVYPGGL